MNRYLFRGVNSVLDEEWGGKLQPKLQGKFVYEFTADCTEITCDNAQITILPSSVNAVHRHQLLQKGYPTSGISTSPKFEVARRYAKGICGELDGFVYMIDRETLSAMGVQEYVVSEYVTNPAVPEDEEVILVSNHDGELSENIIIEKIKV